MPNALRQLQALGQSVWYDNISRGALQGELARLVADGEVQGVTSNPTIFEKAVGGGADYDADIAALVRAGRNTEEVFWELAIADIAAGADLLRPVFDQTGGRDGYVSLEVSPELATDGPGTVAEAQRLFRRVGRPNVMIKIPATAPCWPAIEECTALGMNINVTMMFAPSHYERVAEAYVRGLERLVAARGNPAHVASVASVFVSRVDTLVDASLDAMAAAPGADRARLEAMRGTAALANARCIYGRFLEIFSDANPRWRALADRGARVQRPLWASTSTKNPRYRDVLYVEGLIGPHTVDTMPPATITAFRDHGVAARTVDSDLPGARRALDALDGMGVGMEEVGATLQEQGLSAFSGSFRQVLHEVETKARSLAAAGR